MPAWRGRGQRPKWLRCDGDDAPVVTVRALVEGLAANPWQAVSWRGWVAEPLASRLAAVRVRPAHCDHARSEPRPEDRFEWPDGEPAPTKFWFSTVPADTAIERLVPLARCAG